VVHSPFGGRVNGAWALALSSAINEQIGVVPEMQANDDGMLFRLPQSGRPPPIDVVSTLTGLEARERIMLELRGSAAFGAQFRMNAARALLLPRARGRKRTPFWLQRLKAKDLLTLVSGFEDFPIVTETYRDCLRDVFDLPHLEEILARIQDGGIRVVPIETVAPSPIAASLLLNFAEQYLYEWDAPRAERQLQALSLPHQALSELLKDAPLSELLRPEAIAEVQGRTQHRATYLRARTAEELMLLFHELGDLSREEALERCVGEGSAWLDSLAAQGRLVEMPIGNRSRFVPAGLVPQYRELSAGEGEEVLRRFLRTASPVTRHAILARYPFHLDWLDATLVRWVNQGELVRGKFTSPEADEYCDAPRFEQMRQRTLTLLRKDVQPVSLEAYSRFLTQWQHAHPQTRLHGQEGVRRAVEQLRGIGLPAAIWERDVLPARIDGYRDELDDLSATGDLVWVGFGRDPKRLTIRLFFRGEGALFLAPEFSGAPAAEVDISGASFSSNARAVHDFLRSEGASFTADLSAGLSLSPSALTEALAELAMAGLLTHDAFDAARRMASAAASRDRGYRPFSALEADLAERLSKRGPRPLTSGRYREARRRVAQRLRDAPAPIASAASGRWSLVHRVGIMGPVVSPELRAERLVRILLQRFGVLARECFEHEDVPWDWAQLYPLLERLEMRGEVRRGYFVAGLSGAQFALPNAVERLRGASAGDEADRTVIVLSACDPAMVHGSDQLNRLRFSRLPSTHVALIGGRLAAVIADNGERVSVAEGLSEVDMERVLRAYLERAFASPHVVVSQWNGARVLGSPGLALLKSLGFERTPIGLEWWAPQA
jgi:ATP-dependent Lhr-like helicase